MTEIHTGAGSPADANCEAKGASQWRFRRHLLAGVATFALLVAGSAYTLRADALLGPGVLIVHDVVDRIFERSASS